MRRFNRVGVLLGGPSAEREVSLNSGRACAKALRDRGYDVVEIDVDEHLAQVLAHEKVDAVFNILHGKWGEDGCVQGLLELLRIPYTGAGVLGSAAAMDKLVTKTLFAAAGIPSPAYLVFDAKTPPVSLPPDFEPPWVIKPSAEGSSVGVTITKTMDGIARAFELAARYDRQVIVERYIEGREIQVGVLAGRALGIVEVKPKPVVGEEFTFYDYAHKYTKGMTQYLTRPEGISDADRELVQELSLRACEALRVEGFARVDFMMDRQGRFFALEVNTLPGMTELSLFPMIARDGAGMSFEDVVEAILNTARTKIGG